MTGAELAAAQGLHEAGAAMLIAFALCGGVGLVVVLADLLRLHRDRRQRRRWRDGLARRWR